MRPDRNVQVAMVALYGASGVIMPGMSIWLSYRSVPPGSVAFVAAAGLVLRALSGLVLSGPLTRWFGRGRAIALGGALAACIFFVMVSRPLSTIDLALIAVGYGLLYGTMPAIEAMALSVASAALPYGRIRALGSMSFLATSSLGALALGSQWFLALFGTLVSIAGTVIAGVGITTPTSVSRRLPPDASVIYPTGRLFIMLVPSLLLSASHAQYNAFAVRDWLAAGISPEHASLLWAVGVVAEIAMFRFYAKAWGSLPEFIVIAICSGAAVLRWTILDKSQSLSFMIVAQLLHSFTFAGAYAATVLLIGRLSPPGRSDFGQALYATLSTGLALGAATALLPTAIQIGIDPYAFMAILAGGALLLSLAMMRQIKASWRGV